MQESTVYQSILAEGEAKGDAKKRRSIVNFLRMGVAIEVIAEAMEMSVEEVKKIQLSESL
jgi:predicted transposase YdaD